MRFYFLLLSLAITVQLRAQKLIAMRTQFNDSFTEWVLETEDEDDFDGNLSITFNTFDDWSFTLGDIRGDIRQKFRGNDATWDVFAEGETITINRVWPRDNREWKLSSGKLRQTIRTRYGNTADEWRLASEEDGFFDIFTEWEGDPRDWIIEENLTEEYSPAFKVAMAFIAVYSSMPKQ